MRSRVKNAITFATLLLSVALFDSGCRKSSPAAEVTQPEAAATPVVSPTPTANVAISTLPAPASFVVDGANVIDADAKQRLEGKLMELKKSSRIEFAVATIETTGESSVADYSLNLARRWGIGPPPGNKDGGLLMLVAIKDRKWHLQVSRALESDLPPNVITQIGEPMRTPFQKGAYGEGIEIFVDRLIAKLEENK
jgi:uncharacterized protein